jgi:hypothetical protein
MGWLSWVSSKCRMMKRVECSGKNNNNKITHMDGWLSRYSSLSLYGRTQGSNLKSQNAKQWPTHSIAHPTKKNILPINGIKVIKFYLSIMLNPVSYIYKERKKNTFLCRRNMMRYIILSNCIALRYVKLFNKTFFYTEVSLLKLTQYRSIIFSRHLSYTKISQIYSHSWPKTEQEDP